MRSTAIGALTSIVGAGLLIATPAAGLASAQRRAMPPPGGDSTYSRVISPVAMLTLMSASQSDGSESLKLLVLWRGSSAWFMRRGPRGSEGSATAGQIMERLEYGGLNLSVAVNTLTGTVRIQDKTVQLKPTNANVILVDSVDSQSGPSVFGTVRIDPSLPDGSRAIEPVLRKSPEIVSFLRCDIKVADPELAAVIDRSCALITSKGKLSIY